MATRTLIHNLTIIIAPRLPEELYLQARLSEAKALPGLLVNHQAIHPQYEDGSRECPFHLLRQGLLQLQDHTA